MPVREVNIIKILNEVLDQTKEMFPRAAVDIANTLIDISYDMWRETAVNMAKNKDGNPSGWGARYANSLKVEMITGKEGTARVYVDEQSPDFRFVELLENGVTTWSIKEALLSGKAARRNKAEYGTTFVRVPFKWRTPGGEKIQSFYAGRMPNDVYQKAKEGIPLGKQYGNMAGMKRYGEGVHGQYMTFRTVSENSKGWIYPNKPSVPIFPETQKRVDRMMEKAILNLINGVGKDLKKKFEK